MNMEQLTKLRTAQKISQADLAKMVGVSQQAISHWEKGIRTPTLEKALKLCEILNCNITDIAKSSCSRGTERKC